VAEWAIALTLSPDQAEAYNGQQGDIWDAHMDMLLATIGALLVLAPALRAGSAAVAEFRSWCWPPGAAATCARCSTRERRAAWAARDRVRGQRQAALRRVRSRDSGIERWPRAARLRSREASTSAARQAMARGPTCSSAPGSCASCRDAAVARARGRMINIHPFAAAEVSGPAHARARARAGDAEHGASVHQVVADVDAGPVIAQARVPVLAGDDADALAARVLAREHPLLVAVVRAFAEGQLTAAPAEWHGGESRCMLRCHWTTRTAGGLH
jgi:phosphoribosylglycinamide formyltransferase-1